MVRIGLTGGIASGKSTAAQLLEAKGVPVIDLDQISRSILQQGTLGYRRVLQNFGKQILTREGDIDRKALGKMIFKNPALRKELEAITHPLILQAMEDKIEELIQNGEKVVVVEVPLLFEAGLEDQFDQIWLVYVDEEHQLNRLKERDDFDLSEAQRRVDAQMSLDKKIPYADKLINNNGSITDMEKQIDKLWREILCSNESL